MSQPPPAPRAGIFTTRRAAFAGAITLLIIGGVSLAGLMIGAVSLTLTETWAALHHGPNAFIVVDYRLPRVIVSALAGAAFGLAGVFLQGALRNPLASPDVVGITKWAALGAFVMGLVLPPDWTGWAVPLGVVTGGAMGAVLLLTIGARLGGGAGGLVLTGVALGLMAQAMMQYVMVLFPTRADQAMVWLAGSVYGSTWAEVTGLTLWLMACLPFIVLAASQLDAAGFSDDTLVSLGITPRRLRGGLIVMSMLLASGAVLMVGSMGFLGLIAPHAARLLVGPRASHVVPLSALMGALILSAADLTGRIVALPNEIPAGIVAAVIGGPYLVFLLLKEGRRNG